MATDVRVESCAKECKQVTSEQRKATRFLCPSGFKVELAIYPTTAYTIERAASTSVLV